MDSQIIEYLNDKYEEEIRVLRENLGQGAAKDYAEYQNLCGVVRGLLTAQRELNDLSRKMKEHDDSL